jgi:hypothetical protein
MVGLCEAAKDWREPGEFARYANAVINNRIRNFITGWDTAAAPKREAGSERAFWEWSSWSDRDYSYALAEHWHCGPDCPDCWLCSTKRSNSRGMRSIRQ